MWKYSSIGKLFLGITATLSLIALGSMRGTINEYWRWVFGLSHLAYFSEGLERFTSLSYVNGHTFYKRKRDVEMKKKNFKGVFFLFQQSKWTIVVFASELNACYFMLKIFFKLK